MPQDTENQEPFPMDLGGFPVNLDDEFLGALEVLKDPAYWESMMIPGYVLTYFPQCSLLLACIVHRILWPNTTAPASEWLDPGSSQT